MKIFSFLQIFLLLVFVINLIGFKSDISASADITIDGENIVTYVFLVYQ